MEKRNLLFVALAAALATACTDDAVSQQEGNAQTAASGPVPVNFTAYTNRGISRSGVVGELTTTLLKDATTDFGKAGFGVFGYYTNGDDYASDSRPNFMFNQQVKWNAVYSLFDYSPVRYWPNEYGVNAQSEDIDKVSFFAYAPYVQVNPSTGYLTEPGELNVKTTWGITATTRNTNTGDPLVKYITSFEKEKSVDLLWGVYNEGESGWSTMNGKQTTTDGLPWLNVQHARSIDQRLKFTFRHATAKLNVQIDANVDGGGTGSNTGWSTELGTHYGTDGTIKDNATKIYVRSISFSGIAAQGALNLNNVEANVPLWMNYSGTGWIENGQSVTIHDGRRDGYEGTAGADAKSETMRGLNPYLISNDGNTSPGVTHESRNLFGVDTSSEELSRGVYVIPTGEQVRMTIVYDVETAVDNLPEVLSDGTTHGTSIENRITTALRYQSNPLVFEGGKLYTLKIHLGMNSVKFDAVVSEDWEEGATIDVPRSDISLSTITQDDIDKNRGTADNPRAWVICEEGELHLCQNGKEVNPTSGEESPVYLGTDDNPLSCGKKKVAVVCYVGQTGSVDKSSVTTDASAYHGLAIALDDCKDATSSATEFLWYTGNSGHCVSSYSYSNFAIGNTFSATDPVYLKGIDDTNQLGNGTGTCSSHTHEAAKQVLAYENLSASTNITNIAYVHPTGTSQWFMPTIDQWSLVLKGLTGSTTKLKFGEPSYNEDGDPIVNENMNADYTAAVVNRYIQAAAGGAGVSDTQPYWASTEYEKEASKHLAWQMLFGKDTNYGYASPADKGAVSTKSRVRAILAF